MSFPINPNQTFFITNTHFSPTHNLHGHSPVATEWRMGIQDPFRPSGFRSYGDPLGHTNFSGQTTLDMFSGGRMNLPDFLNR